MAFLAQTVGVPPEHQAKKLVRRLLGPDNTAFDWSIVSRGLFKVRSGEKSPVGAYVKIPYRGHWFWINDDDLESKSTFALLSQLFSLQAATSKGNAPILTLPGRQINRCSCGSACRYLHVPCDPPMNKAPGVSIHPARADSARR